MLLYIHDPIYIETGVLGLLTFLGIQHEGVGCTFSQIVDGQDIRVVGQDLEDCVSRAPDCRGDLTEACCARAEVVCIHSFVTEYISNLVVREDLEQTFPQTAA